MTTIVWLDRVIPPAPNPPQIGGARSPMRTMTWEIAHQPGGWDSERRTAVRALFDGMASDWNSRHDEHHPEPLVDALRRGGLDDIRGTVCDVGSGTGLLTETLTAHFATVISVDVASEMLRLAPSSTGYRVQADGAALPLADASLDALLLFNAFLFPLEAARVVRPRGAVIWISGLGEDTPIALPIDEVAALLPGNWPATASHAGWGTWAVFRRH